VKASVWPILAVSPNQILLLTSYSLSAFTNSYHFSLLKNEFQKPKKSKRITIKSPSVPLFQRGKLTSPPFGLWPGGKREAGRDFQSAKVLQ
jgi:hypothetical protein